MIRHSYSSDVDLALVLDDQQIELSHVGQNMVIVRGVVQEIPPRDAKLMIRVDGSTTIAEVFLQDGIPAGDSPCAIYFLRSCGQKLLNAPGFWR